MKIFLKESVHASKVLSDDGTDITDELHVSRIEVVADPKEHDGLVMVRLTCLAQVELDIRDEKVELVVRGTGRRA